MNAENFSEYLKNPSFLYQISYEELKTLTLQYPYSQNLRLLLLQKSRLDNNKDYERNFQLASTYSVDRSHLYRFLKETAEFEGAEETTLDEVLELRDLSELDLQGKEKIALGGSTESTTDESNAPVESTEDFSLDFTPVVDEDAEETFVPSMPELPDLSDILLEEESQTFVPEEPLVFTNPQLVQNLSAISAYLENSSVPQLEIDEYEPSPISFARIANLRRSTILGYPGVAKIKPFFVPKQIIKSCIRITNIVEELLLESKQVARTPRPERLTRKRFVLTGFAVNEQQHSNRESVRPMSRHNFKSWHRMHTTSPLDSFLHKEERSAPEVVGAEVFAAQSVQESKDVASETLAELLVRQGQLEKAIEMYRRLSLIFPKKSSYFATQIEVLEIKQRNKYYL